MDERFVQQLQRQPHQVPTLVLLVISATLTPPTSFDRRVALLVNPYLIGAAALATAVVFALVRPAEVLVWAAAAAAIAGWSAAWSP
jgi:hypothetical protein